jgi:flagellar basal-body rod modification protein FlgD
MDVTSTGAATTAQQSTAKATAGAQKSALSSDFETFLRMLTTQMENQDPLNPMESTEFATQLATFSSVEQQTKSNELLASMVSQLGIMSMSQITAWVGMDARSGGQVWIDNRAVEFTPKPTSAADRMAIVVMDEHGKQVGRLEMPASEEPLSWTPTGVDGQPLPAGAYSFVLESLSGAEILATAPLETYAPVVEVRNEDGVTQLVLEGGVKIAPSEVTALRRPAA